MENTNAEPISLSEFLSWEERIAERHEWIDGIVVPYAGVSFEHGAIATNVMALLYATLRDGRCFVQPSDRQLVPRTLSGRDLGSFYADVTVSCEPSDRTGSAAHFPTVVIEILSKHIGAEFTEKKRCYLESAKLADYIIIDSLKRYVYRYGWRTSPSGQRKLVTAEYALGAVPVPSLGIELSFDDIYAGTDVPALSHPLILSTSEESEILVHR